MVSAALPLPASSSSWEFIVSSPFPVTHSSVPLDATAREGQGGLEIKPKRSLKRLRAGAGNRIGDQRWSRSHPKLLKALRSFENFCF